MKVWILCNERAGRGLSADDVRNLVERAGHTVVGVAKEYEHGTPPPDGHLDLVVAAGGDGTVATAAGVASNTSAALAILPLGTANNIAASLGVEGSAPELIASWTGARRMSLDLGCAHVGPKTWLMVEGAGGGLVPAGIARAHAHPVVDRGSAPPVKIAAASRAFRDALIDLEPRAWTLVVDGKAISKSFLLVEVLNMRSVGPNLVFAPDADPSDGFFDVVMAEPCHRVALLSYLEERVEGREGRDSVVSLPCLRARTVVIRDCAELHIDDERVDASHVDDVSLRVNPAAITVLV